MAGADYKRCDLCGSKAFYDTDLSYDTGDKINGEWVYSPTPYREAGVDQGKYGTGLGYGCDGSC